MADNENFVSKEGADQEKGSEVGKPESTEGRDQEVDVQLEHPSPGGVIIPSQSTASIGKAQAGPPPLPIWFSVKYTYKIDRAVFKGAVLPLKLTGINGEDVTIYQISEKSGNNPKIYLLTIEIKKEVDISAKRHKEFTDKLGKGECVDRLNDSHKIKATLDDHVTSMEDEIDRVQKLVRWRFKFECDDINYPRVYHWSADNVVWNKIICCRPPAMVSVDYVFDITFPKDQIESELQALINKGEREPLHHALLREAKSILFSNPQSAFVIAVSALEVGAKYFISRRVPESEWLMSNVASPDLVKILGDYFKVLDGTFVLEADKLEEVRKIIGNRNTMVHSGKMSFYDQRIVDAVKFIERILGKIDNHLGYNW